MIILPNIAIKKENIAIYEEKSFIKCITTY